VYSRSAQWRKSSIDLRRVTLLMSRGLCHPKMRTGAIMTKWASVLALAIFAAASYGTAAAAQTALSESPITPGFWSFPRKPAPPSDIAATCRAHLEIHFADGHFIALRMQKRDMGLYQREVEAVGRCTFDQGKQADVCEIKNFHTEGSILAGVLTIKYTLDPKSGDAQSGTKSASKPDAKAGQNSDGKRIAKIVVTPKMITDSPVDNAPYDAFPVRCPDDTVWTILNETVPPK
jgi:hypothetical protein